MLSSFPPIRLLCRKGMVKKRDPGDDDEPESKVDPDADVKGECKDEDSGAETEDGKSKATVPGEEADVRDIIYNLEILGTGPIQINIFWLNPGILK